MKKNELNEIAESIFDANLNDRGGVYDIGSSGGDSNAVVDGNKHKLYIHIDLPWDKYKDKLLSNHNWSGDIEFALNKIEKFTEKEFKKINK